MSTEDVIKDFMKKYIGEQNNELIREIEPETARVKYLFDDSMEYIDYYIDSLKNMFKGYVSTKREGMQDKSEQYALECNNLAHNLIYEAFVIWKLTEEMRSKD